MHELTFADAAIPAPRECLGLPLDTYCLRHELVLLRHRSPFLCMDAEQFSRLPVGERVFAVTFAAQLCAKRKPGWFWGRKPHDYERGVVEFYEYLIEGRKSMPVLSSSSREDCEAYEMAGNGEKMTGGRSMGSPMIASLINYCMNTMRLSYEDALASPYAHVANLFLANLESGGQIYIENHQEAAVKAEMAAKREKIISDERSAEQAWAAATTPEAQKAAYERCPEIANLFAKEFYKANSDAERDEVVTRWGIVAETELKKAGISRKENVWQA